MTQLSIVFEMFVLVPLKTSKSTTLFKYTCFKIFSSTSPHSPSSTAAENQTRNGNSIRKTIAKWLRLQRPNNSNKSSDVKKQNHGRSRYKLTGMSIKSNLYTVDSGNSKRLNSKQSLISKHFCLMTPIVL